MHTIRNKYNVVFYTFKPNSSLQLFITKKTMFAAKRFTLFKLLTTLKKIICDENLFDPNNPSVILCSTDLEDVLQTAALHIRDLRRIVLKQLEPKPKLIVTYSFKSLQKRQLHPNSNINFKFSFQTHKSAKHCTIKKPWRTYVRNPHKNEKFIIKPDFYKILSSLPDLEPNQQKFLFQQVLDLFCKYVEQRHLLTNGIIFLSHDPLGLVFNVKAIHVSQIKLFVLKHLVLSIEEDVPACKCI